MPTIFRHGGYRFFFFSGDKEEPKHVHVEKENKIAKFWLNPVRLQNSSGFRRSEISDIYKIIIENIDVMLGGWDEYFNG